MKSFFGLCMTLSIIEQEWPSIAGNALASRSLPKSYDDGVLVVLVENSLAQQDMNFKKNAILKEIRAKASLRLKDIRTEIGRLSAHRPKGGPYARARRTKRALRPIPKAELDAMVSEVMGQDPNIAPDLAAAIARCRILGEPR
jgi:hypothetical protein